jgi:hypothetical protein
MEEKADMTNPVSDFLDWLDSLMGKNREYVAAFDILSNARDQIQLKIVYDALPDEQRNDVRLKGYYDSAMKILPVDVIDETDPAEKFISDTLDSWLDTIKKYETSDPAKAKENLTKLSADVMKIAATSAVIDLGLGMLPNSAGTASSANTKQILAWLGVGAVVTAIAHDPVKIGLLRPYQDSLEATFRNRRPDDFALFQAYKTRELSPSKPTLEELNNDTAIDKIEKENDDFYFREIAKWGYSDWFAGALSRSATITLNFSQLSALARQGMLSRGLAAYSLWGQGLDRTVFKPALDALMKQNQMASYEGFRSMIEPSYVEGDITEADLGEYWDRIAVPKDIQAWVLPRMKKRREAYLMKQSTGAAVKERDLTVSQIQQAYQNLLLDRAKAQNMILSLGYSLEEAKILLDLAELRRKLPGAATLKRLTLTDYEKAQKNGIITAAAVLDRMKGEYAPEDIELERKLLEIGKA